MKIETITIEAVIAEIAKTLKEKDGLTIEDMANEMLNGEFEYQGDGIFLRRMQ